MPILREMPLAAPVYDRVLKACLAKGAELRRHSRIAVHIEAQIILGTRGAAAPVFVTITDMSPGGIGFTSHEPLAVDEWIVVQLPLEAGDTLPLLIEVRHCRLKGDATFAIGAKFMDDPLGAGPLAQHSSRPASTVD